MKNIDIIRLQQGGLQQASAHDVSPAHAYKLSKLKREVQKAFDELVEREKDLMKDCDIEDYGKDRERLRDMKKRMSALSAEEKKEFDALHDRLEHYDKMHEELMNDDTPLSGVKTMPYEDWHRLQAENRAKSLVLQAGGRRFSQTVDIFTGELEFILEDVLWRAPEEDGPEDPGQ